MASILAQSIGDILDNYADVIEGGSAYASGTVYTGIAGTQSNSEFSGDTVTAEAGSTTTSIAVTNTYGTDRFVTVASPPWFLVGLTGTAGNIGAARKISAVSSSAFTVAAFPSSPAADDTYEIREGFRRVPDSWDIEDDGEGDEGWDRFFQLSMIPGRRWPYYGNTVETYESTMDLRLRILKRGRSRKAINSAMENVLFMRSVMTQPSNRDGTYVQLLEAESTEPEITTNDAKRIVVTDKYRCIFRVGADFL